MERDEFAVLGILSSANELLTRELDRMWSSLLDFRAAANAAINNTGQPIKKRVLDRIWASNEIRTSLLRLLRISSAEAFALHGLSAEETVQRLKEALENRDLVENLMLPDFFERLSRDRRFATIVMEAVTSERRWSDLLDSTFDSLTERSKAFVEKIFDKHHPVSRVAASLLLSGGTLLVAFQLAPDAKKLRVPLDVDFSANNKPISLKLDAGLDGQTVPLRFVAPDPVPVTFQSNKPVDLRLLYEQARSNGFSPQYKTDLSPVVQKLEMLNQEIGTFPSGTLDKTSARNDSLISAVQSLRPELNGIATSVGKVVEASNANTQRLDSLASTLMNVGLRANSFREIASSLPASASIVVPVKSSGEVFLQWLDAGDEPRSCIVKATVSPTKSKTRFKLSLSVDECSPATKAPLSNLWSDGAEFGPNEPKPLGDQVPYHVVLVAAEHPWFSEPRVILRFQPDAQKNQAKRAPGQTQTATASDTGEATHP